MAVCLVSVNFIGCNSVRRLWFDCAGLCLGWPVSMNLHGIVAPYVAAVNPWTFGSYQESNGYTTDSTFKRVPAYAPAVAVAVQRQALTYKDLMQLDGLNLNGEKAAIYVSGDWRGVDRPAGRGGDLINMQDGTVWIVAQVLENWFSTDGWAKLACTKQLS